MSATDDMTPAHGRGVKRSLFSAFRELQMKSGQTATEYVLVLVMVVILIISGMAFVGDDMENFMSKVNSGLSGAMDD